MLKANTEKYGKIGLFVRVDPVLRCSLIDLPG